MRAPARTSTRVPSPGAAGVPQPAVTPAEQRDLTVFVTGEVRASGAFSFVRGCPRRAEQGRIPNENASDEAIVVRAIGGNAHNVTST
jgi:hypothetical protein